LYETLEELNEEVRKLILYSLKISAEKKFENKQEDLTREYEEFRFNLRTDYELIAVQGYCENCKDTQNLALHYKDLTSRKVNCPSCNTKQMALEIWNPDCSIWHNSGFHNLILAWLGMLTDGADDAEDEATL
jgi:hypothetical protein